MPGKSRPLADLKPYWLPEGNNVREKMGVGFVCPVHRDHHVVFYFRHPLDGESPQPLTPLVEVEDFFGNEEATASFDEMTLYYREGDTGPLVAPCGAMFWVIGGEVILRKRKES